VFAHGTNRDRKPPLEVVKTGLSDLANQRVRFYQDRQLSGAPPGFDEELLLQPSYVWTV
jgi:hypothetical protein